MQIKRYNKYKINQYTIILINKKDNKIWNIISNLNKNFHNINHTKENNKIIII